jgi:hypothetical protein
VSDVRRLVFTIVDVFEIAGRGVVISPGVPVGFGEKIGEGTPLLMKRPDGTITDARVAALGRTACGGLAPEEPNSGYFSSAILLTAGPRKEDLPPGTEVWIELARSQ